MSSLPVLLVSGILTITAIPARSEEPQGVTPRSGALEFQQTLQNVLERMTPSVVLIRVEGQKPSSSTSPRRGSNRQGRPGKTPPQPAKPVPPGSPQGTPWLNPQGSERAAGIIYGAGFFIDDRNHILTNYHLVRNAASVKVVTTDKRERPATLLGYDSNRDLVVLEFRDGQSGTTYPAIPLGNSSLVKAGDFVMAVGHPFGYTTSATFGIVSSVGQLFSQAGSNLRIPNLIQTDAAMNAGNAGGPLINLQGEAVGIAILDPMGAALAGMGGATAMTTGGLGFAVPINDAKDILHDLIAGTRIKDTRPWMGVGSDATFTHKGVRISMIEPDSPAEAAGLEVGDIITAMNGQMVETIQEFMSALMAKKSGDVMTVAVKRVGGDESIDVELATRPDPESK